MSLWNLIVWIVVGGLAGWVASMIVGNNKSQGFVGNIIVGILGAFVGGFLVSLLGGSGFTGFNLWSFIVSVVGAVILLLIWRAITGRSRA